MLGTDGGEVLLERDGYSWDWFAAGDDGGLLYDEAPDGEPQVTVVSTLVRGAGHLIVTEPTSMTALAP